MLTKTSSSDSLGLY